MPPTMRDIANLVGVSVPTVSRVLRDSADDMVTELTRERIRQAAFELGYQPNPHARALASGKSSSIVVVAPLLSQAMNARKTSLLCHTLTGLLRETFVITEETDCPSERLKAILTAAVPQAVLFLTSSWQEDVLQDLCQELYSRDIWPLLVDPLRWQPDRPWACDVVLLNRNRGAQMAVNHLVSLGHRHIGLLTSFGGEPRALGFDQALTQHGITERYHEYIRSQELAPVAARRGVQRLLDRHPQITALFCGSDLQALGVLQGLWDRGLRVPEDFSLVGFDDQEWAAHLSVPLTTVAQPVEEMCRVAVEILEKRLRGDQSPWQWREIIPQLIVRETTRAYPPLEVAESFS